MCPGAKQYIGIVTVETSNCANSKLITKMYVIFLRTFAHVIIVARMTSIWTEPIEASVRIHIFSSVLVSLNETSFVAWLPFPCRLMLASSVKFFEIF